jgi:hypothetical protein
MKIIAMIGFKRKVWAGYRNIILNNYFGLLPRQKSILRYFFNLQEYNNKSFNSRNDSVQSNKVYITTTLKIFGQKRLFLEFLKSSTRELKKIIFLKISSHAHFSYINSTSTLNFKTCLAVLNKVFLV